MLETLLYQNNICFTIQEEAILIGNLEGHGLEYGENLVTVESLRNYFLPGSIKKR